MADSSGRMVTTTSERGQWGHNKTNMAALATLRASLLKENDIPGASICVRKPSELKNEELKFWLKCRGDPAKGLKTKAELVKRWEITLFSLPSSLASRCLRRFEVRFYSFLRVEEYIRSGRDKSIVYSDPNGLYTKRKQQRRSTPSASSIEPSQGARLCISQFHLRPAPPPPRATAGHLHALSVPGMGHLQILHYPEAGHSPTPGHSRGFDTHAVSYQNMTTQKVLLEKSRLAHLSRTGINWRGL